ncbi:MAG: dethiobiotin synthase [Candidatus Omnitrophica bacterium]|nr:dethiobiotin synthase [Candidatus Omnitrophota bacterium]
MNKSIFIAGTDTGAGKTVITGLLAGYLAGRGLNVITQKWVQTGNRGLSEDILAHMEFLDNGKDLLERYHSLMAPYVFGYPASPHLAAGLEQAEISIPRIIKSHETLKEHFDIVIVEASGGVLVPLNRERTMIDLVRDLGLEVIMVAANKLGAINHTLLSIEALVKRDITIAGVIFNRVSEHGDDTILADNVKIIEKFSGVKVLGEIGFGQDKAALRAMFRPIGARFVASARRGRS